MCGGALEERHGRGVHAAALDGFDSATAAPPLDVVGLLRKANREYAAERGHATIEAARRRGSRIGRPRVEIDIAQAVRLRRTGRSIRRIALTLGCSATSVHRALRAAERDATARRNEPREAA